MGAGDPDPLHLAEARELGRRIAEQGWIVLTGGRSAGVMEAASAGAKEVRGSVTLGILPDDRADLVSLHVDIAILTDLGNARNNLNVLTSRVVVACGVESAGTASEVALAIKNGRPVILLRPSAEAWAFFRQLGGGLAHRVETPADAVELIGERLGLPRGAAWEG